MVHNNDIVGSVSGERFVEPMPGEGLDPMNIPVTSFEFNKPVDTSRLKFKKKNRIFN